jgi:hypothetical protein
MRQTMWAGNSSRPPITVGGTTAEAEFSRFLRPNPAVMVCQPRPALEVEE